MALESNPATLMVNPEDSNSHTLTQLASEAVTNTPQSEVPDIDANINRDDSTNNELGSELATKGLHSPSDWQKKRIHRFNNIADSIQLEETLNEFIEEAKITHQRSEAPQTQTRDEPQPRQPQQFHHRQRKQHRRQEKQYDAAAASRIQKLYRHSRDRATREVTEAEPTFCKIPSDGLFEHFSRTFQQRQPTDQTMPMEVPPFVECSPDDQNPFAEEFTQEEVWTVCTAAATRLQAQTEYAMHNGRKWTKADMPSTRYLTPYIA